MLSNSPPLPLNLSTILFSPSSSAGVQANEQYGEQFVVMFTLVMTQLKQVRATLLHMEQCRVLRSHGSSADLKPCSACV